MKITDLGHASFLVEAADGSVIFDPYKDYSVTGMGKYKRDFCVDLVLCSHGHDDHNAKEYIKIKSNPNKINYELFAIPHDKNGGTKRGMNNIACVHLENKRIVHLGDIGIVDEKILKNIEGCDVLLCPINGFFTISALEAKQVFEIVKPKLFIPMHYRDNRLGVGYPDDNQIEQFSKLFPSALKVKKSSINLEEISSDINCVIFEDYLK